MTTKLTLCAMVILLIIVVAASYYVNKEGFQDITSASLVSALNTVQPESNKAILSGVPTPGSQLQPNNPILPGVPTPSSQDGTIPSREDVVPQVTVSGAGYDALTLQQRMDLLKDIQKVVRNEILANRSTKPVISGETRQDDTDATAQGKEYEDSCYKNSEYRCPKNPDGSCPPIPDMTQYIKKDAIPCWGCSLDY